MGLQRAFPLLLCGAILSCASTVGASSTPAGNTTTATKPFRFGCDTTFKLLDSTPFGRGYQKSVWRAVSADGFEFVLKRPAMINPGKASLFQRAARREVPLLKSLPGKHVLRTYGSCLENSNNGTELNGKPVQFGSFAVEGGLVKFLSVAKSPLPWCTKAYLLHQLFEILRMLRMENLMHCDFKHDQVVVSFDGIVKVVDLDTMSKMTPPQTAIYQDKPCTKDDECIGCLHHPLSNHTDGRCENNRCVGVDISKTVLQVIGLTIFPILFSSDDTHPFVREDMAALREGITRFAKKDRWDLDQASAALTAAMDKHNGALCLRENAERSRAVIERTSQKLIESAARRCVNTYC